jgi:hypothetical protein
MNRYADKYVIPYLTVLDRSKAQAKEKSALGCLEIIVDLVVAVFFVSISAFFSV